ncbi:hypothetical protein FLA_5433 [Filimonas lacunae]|nr:hypothetical protein FLA_5433 [Filimonas lacunae]
MPTAIPGFDMWLTENKGAYAPSHVMALVSSALKVEMRYLRAKEKPQWITDARQIYCFFARYLTQASYNEIGTKIGRLHSSVITAERNIQNKLSVKDERIVDKVATVYQYMLKEHKYGQYV